MKRRPEQAKHYPNALGILMLIALAVITVSGAVMCVWLAVIIERW